MNDKLLAEYCGLRWHTVTEYRHPVLFVRMNRCTCGRDVDTHLCVNPEFSTPEGYELLHNSLDDLGDWEDLYIWLNDVPNKVSPFVLGCIFHEFPCDKKSQIISDWLEETQ